MAVPEVNAFYRPVLEIAAESNGIVARKAIITKLTTKLSLNRSDLRETIPSGKVTKVVSRTSWVLSVLKQSGMVQNPQWGQYQITRQGRDLLAKYPRPYALKYADFEGLGKPLGESASIAHDVGDASSFAPVEQIQLIHQELQNALASEILDSLALLEPEAFERLAVSLLEKMGYGEGSTTPPSHDEGIDGILRQDPLGLEKIYIQAKRWNTASVPQGQIMDFHTSLVAIGAHKGVFITNSNFAGSAKTVAANFTAQGKPISLIDGPELVQLMIRYGLGVRTKDTYEIKELDAVFFDEL